MNLGLALVTDQRQLGKAFDEERTQQNKIPCNLTD